MNKGTKKYICPNCNQPFTKLERGDDPHFHFTGFEKIIGNIASVFMMFIGLPIILVGLAVFIYYIYTKNLAMLVLPVLFIILGSFFFFGGLDNIYPLRRKLCPHCDMKLRKKGTIYIAEHDIETKTDTGQYICPACGSRFIKTIQRKSYGGILFGIMSFAIGTGCLSAAILARIPELTGRIFLLCFGAVWAGVGILIIRQPLEIIEKCPICKTRLEKRGSTYQIYHPPVNTSGIG